MAMALFPLGARVLAQVNPPAPPAGGSANPAATVVPVTAPPAGPTPCSPVDQSASPLPSPDASSAASPAASALPASPAPAVPTCAPAAVATPTVPPIIVEPPSAGVVPGGTTTLRANGIYGTLYAASADPAIADVTVNSAERTIAVSGKAIGVTTITVRDDHGSTRDVKVTVAYPAGTIANNATVRITGDPATSEFVKRQAMKAAVAAATLRPGARVVASTDTIDLARNLPVDDVVTLNVPLILQGEGYFTVQGTTRVSVENFALPRIHPSQLLVSDYPERLQENGVLFAADLTRDVAQRFLYYHYNPPDQPARRLLLKVENTSTQPAVVQMIEGAAGPGPNEMEVGHLSTQRFLVRVQQNEGNVIAIPPQSTVNLIDHSLPPGNIVSALLQLREVEGPDLKLTLVAQDASARTDLPIEQTALLAGGIPHARGVYPVPEFFFDYTWSTDAPYLEVPIGQLPLPNMREGQALGGDYGVLQSVTVTIVNPYPAPVPVAIYANPRGGRATGTFVIDGTLVQAHALPAFSRYKLRQYTVPARAYIRVNIVTMPEGGSSYPLRLIFAPDDGSTSPGASNSPVY